jgi:DNA-binding winged helix-turn-helix (wHTH) protein
MALTRTDRPPAQIRFRSCVLDLESHRLYRDGRDVHITPKAFELLKILVEQAPKALTKAELLDRLWPDTFVSDDALARLISDVRVTIGDSARQPKLIRTIHGFGYAFDAEISEDAAARRPQAPCKVTWASHEFPLGDGENVIGRDPDVAVPINAAIVSRRHARILVSQGTATIEDLGSKNGTFVDDQRLTAPRILRGGEVIKVGDHELTFWAPSVEDLPTLTHQP